MKLENGFPRRIQLNLLTPAEIAIQYAIDEVEKIGADVSLTKFVSTLSEQKDQLSDFIESKPPTT